MLLLHLLLPLLLLLLLQWLSTTLPLQRGSIAFAGLNLAVSRHLHLRRALPHHNATTIRWWRWFCCMLIFLPAVALDVVVRIAVAPTLAAASAAAAVAFFCCFSLCFSSCSCFCCCCFFSSCCFSIFPQLYLLQVEWPEGEVKAARRRRQTMESAVRSGSFLACFALPTTWMCIDWLGV